MSDATIDPRLQPARIAPKRSLQFRWSDPRFRNIVWQLLVLGIVASIVSYLVVNTTRNLAARHIATGFAFLGRTAGIPIGEHAIDYDPAINTYGRAFVIGILNTLKVAIVGVVLATILGTLIGVARLSTNWLIARLSAVYVEVIRDVPVLLQLLFWYMLLQRLLPAPRQSIRIAEFWYYPSSWFPALRGLLPLPADGNVPMVPGFYLSNRGIKFPLVDWVTADWFILGAFVIGLVGTMLWSRVAARRQELTGVRPRMWPVGVGLMLVLPALVWAAVGMPSAMEVPELRGFNFVGGGTISPEYTALTAGLVLYTSAYIAEIVRSGILAVPNGQWEAANALGLRSGPTLRRIVLPQAMRVIIPPMTSQYLNLTKNSSLAVAIGFQDVTSLASTTLNQTGQAIEAIALVMAVYLTISLSISAFMNWYNARIALVER